MTLIVAWVNTMLIYMKLLPFIEETFNRCATKNYAKELEILGNGIRKSMSQFRDIEGAKDLTNKENTGILDNIIKKYESKQLQKDGYFPVLTFDIMPTLSRASELLYSSKGDTRQEAIDMIKSVDKIFSDNAYINEHLGNTNKQINGPINYNVIPIIDSYVRSANRFNYTSFNVLKYSELLKNINDVALKAQNDKGMYELDAKLKVFRKLCIRPL